MYDFVLPTSRNTRSATERSTANGCKTKKTGTKCRKTLKCAALLPAWGTFAFLLSAYFTSGEIYAQQIHLTNPMQRNGSSFSESIGTNWGLSGKNWSLNVGSPQQNNLPRYGGYDMNSGMRGGFQFQRGGTSGYFNGWAGQSYDGYSTMEAPSVTFMNGQTAFFQHVTETPFVVSTIPVVGSWHGTNYQPFYDPNVTLTPSVLQQRIDQLEPQKHTPQTMRETPNAPAKKELPKKKSARNAGKKARPSQNGTARSESAYSKGSQRESAKYSRSTNPNTAETPALSVAEMKRRHRARQEQERSRERDE